jgi:hypothetical protein
MNKKNKGSPSETLKPSKTIKKDKKNKRVLVIIVAKKVIRIGNAKDILEP